MLMRDTPLRRNHFVSAWIMVAFATALFVLAGQAPAEETAPAPAEAPAAAPEAPAAAPAAPAEAPEVSVAPIAPSAEEAAATGLGAGGKHVGESTSIDSGRLLAVDMLAGANGGCEVHRPRGRRRREDHEVNVGRQHLPPGIDAAVLPLCRTVELAAHGPREQAGGFGKLIGEEIPERRDHHVVSRGHRLHRRARASSSTADHTHPQPRCT